MFTAIRQGKAKPGQVSEVAQRVHNGFVPILRQIPGFAAYYFVDMGQDQIMTIGLYQTKTGAEESNTLLSEWAKDNLQSLLATPPQALGPGEVVINLS